MPAKAGIQAGGNSLEKLDSRFRGNDGDRISGEPKRLSQHNPFAGMTARVRTKGEWYEMTQGVQIQGEIGAASSRRSPRRIALYLASAS
ncbi:MAG TPA: hypothetical protein VJ779_00390, partial [Acetobacteraceae bacterium]|nr:hypothetical protein [Acetobacteraceae bacterium]